MLFALDANAIPSNSRDHISIGCVCVRVDLFIYFFFALQMSVFEDCLLFGIWNCIFFDIVVVLVTLDQTINMKEARRAKKSVHLKLMLVYISSMILILSARLFDQSYVCSFIHSPGQPSIYPCVLPFTYVCFLHIYIYILPKPIYTHAKHPHTSHTCKTSWNK